MRKFALSIAVCLMLTGCSSLTSDPSSDHGSNQQVTVSPDVKPQPMRWHTGDFQNGVQIYWHTVGSAGTLQRNADRLCKYAVSLGANSVGISFPIYTDGARPTKVYTGSETPGPQNIGVIAATARAYGLRVTLRPIIDEANIATTSDPNAWRGSIQPHDTAAWFASYQRLLKSYVSVANDNQVREFVVGTELTSMQRYSTNWSQVRQAIRQAGFKGVLSYAFNWSDQAPMPFTSLGIDAYPSLALSDNASLPQLKGDMIAWYHQRPAGLLPHMTAQEVGIAAQSGMYHNPWRRGTGTARNPQIQSRWFLAMCQATHQVGARGVYYWMLDSNLNPSHPGALEPTGWVGQPSVASIKRCFSIKSS